MAEKLAQEFDIKPELREGRGGVFDVVSDGKLIFSKHKAGRFPEDDEVLNAIKE